MGRGNKKQTEIGGGEEGEVMNGVEFLLVREEETRSLSAGATRQVPGCHGHSGHKLPIGQTGRPAWQLLGLPTQASGAAAHRAPLLGAKQRLSHIDRNQDPAKLHRYCVTWTKL